MNLPAWHPHLEVWILVGTLAGAYLYAIRRIGPHLAKGGQPVAGWQIASFLAGLAALWAVSDWPVHDLADSASFGIHSLEHLVQGLIVPPLLLMGTPGWLAREIIPARLLPVVRAVTRPLPAFLAFNALMLAFHWPVVVTAMLRSEPFHLAAHAAMVVAGLVMWMPVLSPLREVPRLSPPLQCVYLFAQSILPTIPASFLTFAEAPIYRVYVDLQPVFGFSVLEDQQVAGLLMKIGGGLVLWTAIAIVFFRWWAEEQRWDRLERELRRSS